MVPNDQRNWCRMAFLLPVRGFYSIFKRDYQIHMHTTYSVQNSMSNKLNIDQMLTHRNHIMHWKFINIMHMIHIMEQQAATTTTNSIRFGSNHSTPDITRSRSVYQIWPVGAKSGATLSEDPYTVHFRRSCKSGFTTKWTTTVTKKAYM